MDVRIVGVDLPGRDWCTYANVHVGVQRRSEVVDVVPGDADEAVWEFPIEPTGNDFRGPHVQGKRGERFLYLSWGTVDEDGTFDMFRRAKLMLGAIDPSVLDAASQPGHRLVAALSLTEADGAPRCAALRPPAVSWTAAPAN